MTVTPLPPETWSTIARRVGHAEGPIAWTWVAALNSNTSKWELAGACIRGAATTEKRLLKYPSIIISTEQITPRLAARRLRAGIVGSKRVLKGGLTLETRSQRRFQPHWMTSERDHGWNLVPIEWPQYVMTDNSIGQATGLQIPWLEALNALGMPFYPSVRAAIAELVYGVPVSDMHTAMGPLILIRLPDLRARLRPATLDSGIVRIPIETGIPAAVRECTLRAAWRPSAVSIEWCRQDVHLTGAGSVEIETGDVPAEMWMILTAPDGRLLDRYGWSDTSLLQPEQTGDVAARVERWIAEGESLRVEFKQELKSDATKVRFAQTVAAFANGEGGVILVGVADDRSVMGWNPSKAHDQITSIIREHVREYAPVEVEMVEVRGRPVQVVTVPAGMPAAKPYRCDDIVMVRVNATTGKATTWEIQQLARQSQTADLSRPFPMR